MFPEPLFRDRSDAGHQLAEAVRRYGRGRGESLQGALVVGLTRGGVPVAHAVARALGLPMDILAVQKIGAPGQEELAVAAVAAGHTLVVNEDVAFQYGLERWDLQREALEAHRRAQAQEAKLREDRPAEPMQGRPVILVDDGLATGATMRAAILSVRKQGARGVIMAVPVAAAMTLEELAPLADGVVCVATPRPFLSVGTWYADFSQVSEAEVRAVLHWPDDA